MTVRWLKSSPEFQCVYKIGKRFDSRYMTVFALKNAIDTNRFGLTASRRVAKNAVDRNRMKRLLREAVRNVSSQPCDVTHARYDFVINAKRSLLGVKMSVPAAELALILNAATGKGSA